jgi:hypothetical protein
MPHSRRRRSPISGGARTDGLDSAVSGRRLHSRGAVSISRGGRPFPPTQLFTARPRLELCREPGASSCIRACRRIEPLC